MNSKRRWAFGLGGLLAALLLLWLWAGVFFNTASAGSGGISMDLRSRILASYGPEDTRTGIARILFSIGEEALRIAGLSESEAAARWRAYEESLNTPVATATARNFLGAAPFTATPTTTTPPTLTSTPIPTATSTSTRVPTRVPTRTPTKTPAATNTPGGSDTVQPTILSVTFGPPPGPLGACVFDVLDMKVFDPAFSSGISTSNVFARVTYPDAYQRYFNLSLASGGFVSGPGSDWDAHYADAVPFKDPTHPAVDGESIFVELKVQDNAGTGWVMTSPVTFTLSGVDCD
ncbi:MAG: hypothetical protein WD906_08065 [Anaerolineales bacterium]